MSASINSDYLKNISRIQEEWETISPELKEIICLAVPDDHNLAYYEGFIRAATLMLNAVTVDNAMSGGDLVTFMHSFVLRCFLIKHQHDPFPPTITDKIM